MPEPVRAGQRYMPGLDGVRALAVLAVTAYHEQFGWAPGGLLGVGIFFTLSGYLITDLLVGQWSADGRVQLRDFWLRRARRLLPALFVMLAVAAAWITVAERTQLPSLRGAVAAAVTYSSNWYIIAAHNSYFARFARPSRSITCGRWRLRSSSTSSGPGCSCWACTACGPGRRAR